MLVPGEISLNRRTFPGNSVTDCKRRFYQLFDLSLVSESNPNINPSGIPSLNLSNWSPALSPSVL